MFCEISTLSSWLLPIWLLQGMCFVKSQLFPADHCPYSSCSCPDWLQVAHIIFYMQNSKFLGSQPGYQLLKLGSPMQFLVALGYQATAKSCTDPADCCPYSSSRLSVLWNLHSFQQIVAHMAVAGYVICEISTLSSWMLPIWQLPGMHFMKSQLFPAEWCPYSSCMVYNSSTLMC